MDTPLVEADADTQDAVHAAEDADAADALEVEVASARLHRARIARPAIRTLHSTLSDVADGVQRTVLRELSAAQPPSAVLLSEYGALSGACRGGAGIDAFDRDGDGSSSTADDTIPWSPLRTASSCGGIGAYRAAQSTLLHAFVGGHGGGPQCNRDDAFASTLPQADPDTQDAAFAAEDAEACDDMLLNSSDATWARNTGVAVTARTPIATSLSGSATTPARLAPSAFVPLHSGSALPQARAARGGSSGSSKTASKREREPTSRTHSESEDV